VLSYRDTFKLFLAFSAKRCAKAVIDLSFDDVGPDIVLAFLEDLELRRGNSVRTRNARLAALHTFFRYVAAQEPQVLDLCQRISAIPVKRAQISPAAYLEYDEVTHILQTIDTSTTLGSRDYLLLRLLFETGLRAQEIAGIRTSALRLTRPYQLTVVGKGGKQRICPLHSETVTLIRSYLTCRKVNPETDAPFFVGARGEQLTRVGVLRAVQRHVLRAAETRPALASKRVCAHTFRHSAAIHLLRAGNDLSVVKSWLGHVSIATTDRYTEIDTETKRQALEATDPVPSPQGQPSWKRDADLLSWLEQL
jgi:site-specific recombinase XerD